MGKLQGDILDAVELIEEALAAGKVGKNNRNRLLKALGEPLPSLPSEVEAVEAVEGEIDPSVLVSEQMALLKSLKIRLATDPDLSVRDLKDGLAASTSMLGTVMKYREEIDNGARDKAHGKAVEKVLGELGEGVLDRFFVLLEEELGV